MISKLTSKRICSRLLLASASMLLATATVFAQMPSGGGSSSSSQQPQQQQPQMQQPTAEGVNSATNENAMQQNMADRAFVKKALEGGQTEVQLGQLAQQKSQSDDVKQFGQKMVQDHTQLGDQMKPIAQQLGVKPPDGPSKKDKEMVAKLEALSGPQFDEAYIQAMLKDHKKDLSDFKDEAQATQNPALKQTAQQGSTVIAGHLQAIQQIAQSHNVTASK